MDNDEIIEVEIVEADEELDPSDGEATTDDGGDDDVVETRAPSGKTKETEAERYKRERDEAKAEAARLKWQKDNSENAAAWNQRLGQIDNEYRKAKQRIIDLSKNDDDPVSFVDREMDRLIAWRDGELGKFHGQREQSYVEQIAQARVPEYVDYLIEKYDLKRADRAKLMAVTPDQMETRAMGLADVRELERSTAGNNRRAAQKNQKVITTGGSGSQNVRRIKAGSDEHLLYLLGEPF